MTSTIHLVNISDLQLHENYDHNRLVRLQLKIMTDGFISDPLLVTKTNNHNFFVMDGVHRYHALSNAGYAYIPVQIFQAEEVNLSGWAHEIIIGSWAKKLQSHSLFNFYGQKPRDKIWIASYTNDLGQQKWIVPKKTIRNLLEHLDYWHMIVNFYKHLNINRISSDVVALPKPGYIRIDYPIWDMTNIQKVVAARRFLPPGTTRFIVKHRIQNLKTPLYLLEEAYANKIGLISCQQSQNYLSNQHLGNHL